MHIDTLVFWGDELLNDCPCLLEEGVVLSDMVVLKDLSAGTYEIIIEAVGTYISGSVQERAISLYSLHAAKVALSRALTTYNLPQEAKTLLDSIQVAIEAEKDPKVLDLFHSHYGRMIGEQP